MDTYVWSTTKRYHLTKAALALDIHIVAVGIVVGIFARPALAESGAMPKEAKTSAD